MDKVAEMICVSKAYDNSTSCSTENNIIVFESCYDEFIKEMEAHGAYLCREGSEEKAKLQKTLWPNTPDDHVLNRAIVAQNAEHIAHLAGLDVPEGTRVIMAEEFNGFGLEHPFTGEKAVTCIWDPESKRPGRRHRKCWPRWNIGAKATAAVSILMIGRRGQAGGRRSCNEGSRQSATVSDQFRRLELRISRFHDSGMRNMGRQQRFPQRDLQRSPQLHLCFKADT